MPALQCLTRLSKLLILTSVIICFALLIVGCSNPTPYASSAVTPTMTSSINSTQSSQRPTAKSVTASQSATTSPTAKSVITNQPTTNNASFTPSVKVIAQPEWMSNWLKAIPCKPPCWEGITPGQTTVDQALKILKSTASYANVKTSFIIGGQAITWDWSEALLGLTPKNTLRRGGDIYFLNKKDNLVLTKIVPHYYKDFTFDSIIKVYGYPTYVLAASDSHDTGNSYELALIYMSQGFLVTIGVLNDYNNQKPPIISPDLVLQEVNFFVPSFDSFADTYRTQNLLVKWQGLKNFDFYCRDRWGDGTQNCVDTLRSNP